MAATMALVVAAGSGSRFGGERPKQYQNLGGRPVLRHCLESLCSHPGIVGVRVVIDPRTQALYDAAIAGLPLLDPVPGGTTRQGSVRCGLESLTADAPSRVLIHDGARPFVDHGLVDRVLGALDEAPGAIAALPVADSLKRGEAGRIVDEVDRAGLWRAQTPQGFDYAAILAAHRTASEGIHTDDAAVAKAAGLAVKLVQGDAANIKITDPRDMAMAESWLAMKSGRLQAETRVGTGYDVHRFGPGDHVVLGGLSIPHDQGLTGHSDSDVALHALTDALFGALAAGDIGQHFPPSDPQWAGADSAHFFRHAVDLLAEAGGRIVHLDLTIICERPKIGPHRAAMSQRIAELAGVPVGRVSVKATTTEKLGFTGRGEGIAAQATATVVVPPVDSD